MSGGCAGSVERIPCRASDGRTEGPHTLGPDGSRPRDVDEAWVPVIAPDGPGVLLWADSD
ncbi:DUF6210 family protein [Streptomyces sp. NPDC059605]|uniref:DUF6210 family protein n=1 Tax=Streptomyces sp. NPDC059605 TaxID=3346882 RepID=UPI0036C7B181